MAECVMAVVVGSERVAGGGGSGCSDKKDDLYLAASMCGVDGGARGYGRAWV